MSTQYAKCKRCGLERAVYLGTIRKPAEFCRDCSPNYKVKPVPCPDCGKPVGKGAALWQHRRKWHKEKS